MDYSSVEGESVTESFSGRNEEKCPVPYLVEYSIYITTVLNICLMPLILTSNFIIIITHLFVRHAYLHTNNSNIIMALAVADFLFGVVSTPVHLLTVIDELIWITHSSLTMCRFVYLAYPIPEEISLSLLWLLCLDRFLAVNWSLTYDRLVTPCKINAAVVFAFLYVIVVDVYHVMEHVHFGPVGPNMNRQCSHVPYAHSTNSFDDVAVIWFLFLLATSLAMCVQVTCVISRKQKDYMRRMTITSTKMKSSGFRQVKLTVYLMFAFIVLWLPSFLTPIVAPHKCQSVYRLWTLLLRSLNSSINAIIYAYCRESYKDAYKFLLTNPPCRWAGVEDVV